MKTLHVEVPDALADEMRRPVEGGRFSSEEEIGRALVELVRRHERELQENLQRADVEWAVEWAEKPD